MPELPLPNWPQGWVHFADQTDLIFATSSVVLVVLLAIWWRQQVDHWMRVVLSAFLAGALLATASYYLFEVPFHYVGCPLGCTGWRGYPLPVATVNSTGDVRILPLDFALNLLMSWLLWLAASVAWRLLAMAVGLAERPLRFKLAFVLLVAVLPWALLPRYFGPPQAEPRGEDQRLAINARRAAEHTYRITGLWVQRLALEDLQRTTAEIPGVFAEPDGPKVQVCLRGYTYFYLAWRRYRITLDKSGVTALNLAVLPLQGSCWD